MAPMDPVDRLIVDEWQALHRPRPRRLALIDAPHLVDEARDLADEVLVWCDDLRELSGVPADLVPESLDADALLGTDAVWMRLPRAVHAVSATAHLIAGAAAPDVQVIAGGRVKHMTHAMTEALSANFVEVSASLGRQKSRVLRASSPRRPSSTTTAGAGSPKHHADLDLDVVALPGVFAGGRIDAGTRLLVAHLPEVPFGRVHDLGCGSGVLATLLARDARRTVSASDVSASAVESTRATAAANGVPVDVAWADGLGHLPDRCLDAVVTNPPFHVGAAKESTPTLAVFADAARVLRPGGELWCVFNSHLPWRAHLQALVGSTRVVDQNRQYTVTRTTRSP